jgi:hypothetical protein
MLEKFIRWPLVSRFNGYMSCESIQQVSFKIDSHLMKYSSSDWNLSDIVKSDWAMILVMFEWTNLFRLA